MTSDAEPARRVALVTGGSGGIGREIALHLAANGFALVVNYTRHVAEADVVAAGIVHAGGKAIAVEAAVADETALAAMFDTVEQMFGGVDVVVHAAGIMPLAPLADLDLDVFDRVVRTNLRGTFVVDQQAVGRVRSGGAIINFSSSVVGLALPTYSAYTATKGAAGPGHWVNGQVLRVNGGIV
jgi:3-oxoacyl-[acyl-carrier protein] reductase